MKREIIITEQHLQAIHEIVKRGNTAEVRLNKEGVIVLEVKREKIE